MQRRDVDDAARAVGAFPAHPIAGALLLEPPLVAVRRHEAGVRRDIGGREKELLKAAGHRAARRVHVAFPAFEFERRGTRRAGEKRDGHVLGAGRLRHERERDRDARRQHERTGTIHTPAHSRHRSGPRALPIGV